MLGMADGTIADFQISASSEHPEYPATKGRQFASGWCALPEDRNPYLQVKFHPILHYVPSHQVKYKLFLQYVPYLQVK